MKRVTARQCFAGVDGGHRDIVHAHFPAALEANQSQTRKPRTDIQNHWKEEQTQDLHLPGAPEQHRGGLGFWDRAGAPSQAINTYRNPTSSWLGDVSLPNNCAKRGINQIPQANLPQLLKITWSMRREVTTTVTAT